MSLTSSLAIGRSALTASQVAIQVTGNNFANASTPGYSRQRVSLVAATDQRVGNYFLGRGVNIGGVTRSVDQALQSRLWNSVSDEAAAGTSRQFLSGVESLVNDLGSNNLRKGFDDFFKAWSELANSPNTEGRRALVIEQGRSLAGQFRALRADLASTRTQIDAQLGAAVNEANNLLEQIASINVNIVNSEGGGAQANALRDQRDELVSRLSEILDVTVIEQPSGTFDILVGSTPIVLAGQNRGVNLTTVVDANGDTEVSVNVVSDGTQLNFSGGVVGGLLSQRTGTLDQTIDNLDKIAGQLIFQLNRVHSVGYGSTPITSVTSTLDVAPADRTRAFNDPQNLTLANLPFGPTNGGFLVTVRNTQSGATETVRVNIDLDGITSSGASGTSDDSSLATVTSDLNGIANLSAAINPNGTLSINADAGYTVSFSEDTSGVLATLGVNTYFTGSTAADIDIRSELRTQPGLLASGRVVNGQPTDNGTALEILVLQTAKNTALGNETLIGAWGNAVQTVGAESAASNTRYQAASLVRANLDAQRSAVSGVSIDEESINLLNYQRQYQGAARFISAVDEMTQTLLSLLG